MNTNPFPSLTGIRYLNFLGRVHAHMKPEMYLEIGTNTGKSLARAPGDSIAIDPEFKVDSNVIGAKRALHMFQMTSDDFFDEKHADKIGKKVDFAFLDGLHLFEFLLRDFMGTEKLCTTKSVIAMHDCVPINHIAADRHWDHAKTRSWTGDVWKLVPILKEYRPDLKVEVIDCPPSGLTFVTNLDPNNDVLAEKYDEIIERYMDMSLEDFGEEELVKELDIQDSREWPANRFIGGVKKSRG